ncbi:MAG: nitrate reductase molybdenum cofactor assembly chaperone [Blastopirellula sp.]|nr:MAG: nitrate reductase molybdenum cofactor assembly chaperone [Blastopirellula sp.]
MSHLPKVLNAFGRLLSYPDEHTVQTAELLYVLLMDELPEVAKDAAKFGAFVEQQELYKVEESYTQIFDINPTCALEIGWHLFGEEYARGMFLVKMREEMRKYELPESAELPDHVCHVLEVVAAMPAEDAQRFVKSCVQPAVETMKGKLEKHETPYRLVIECLSSVLTHTWGEPAPVTSVTSETNPEDLLHRHPVRHSSATEGEVPNVFASETAYELNVADMGQSSCCGSQELVQIDLSTKPQTVTRKQ